VVDVHVGVHSGLVIVRDGPSGVEIVGAAPQVAAGIADRADEDVLLSDETRKLLRREIACAEAGITHEVGPGQRLALHRVGAEEPSPGSLSAAGEPARIERTEELAQLLAAWQRAESGVPRMVLLTGEPGIGKSRLVRELRQAVPAGAWLECRCVPENVTS